MRRLSSDLVSPASEDDARCSETGPLARAIRQIVDRHHQRLREQLRALEELLQPIERAQRPLVVKVRRFRREQEAHLLREERGLFPLIEELESAHAQGRPLPRRPFGPLRNAIAFMEEDHLLADRYLAQMRALAQPGGPSSDALPGAAVIEQLDAIAADLRMHVAAEDADLFPAAIRLEET